MKLQVSLSANLILLVVGAVLLFAWRGSENQKDYWQGTSLSKQLELGEEDRAKVVFRGNTVHVRERIKTKPSGTAGVSEGPEAEIIKKRGVYVPPEGPGAVLTIPNDPTKEIKIDVRRWGWTLTPGLAAVFAQGKLQPEIDIKGLYFDRYGLNAGAASEGLTLGISRHLDDHLRWFPNLEVYAGVQEPWDELKKGMFAPCVFLGVRSNL